MLGKSDQNEDNFDILIFGSQYLENITIPANIIEILAGSFANCTKLQSVEIPENSELKIIHKSAFKNTFITKISIPKQVTEIDNFCFAKCENLEIVEIQKDSELRFIDEYTFSETSNENIFIPKHVKAISD